MCVKMDTLSQLLWESERLFFWPSNCLFSTFRFIYFGELGKGLRGTNLFDIQTWSPPGAKPGESGSSSCCLHHPLLLGPQASLPMSTPHCPLCYHSLSPAPLQEPLTWSPSFLYCRWRPHSTFRMRLWRLGEMVHEGFTMALAQKLSVKFYWGLSLSFMMITAHVPVGRFYWELTDLFPLDVVLF